MYTDHNAHTKIREREDVEINTEGVERERGDVGLGSPAALCPPRGFSHGWVKEDEQQCWERGVEHLGAAPALPPEELEAGSRWAGGGRGENLNAISRYKPREEKRHRKIEIYPSPMGRSSVLLAAGAKPLRGKIKSRFPLDPEVLARNVSRVPRIQSKNK